MILDDQPDVPSLLLFLPSGPDVIFGYERLSSAFLRRSLLSELERLLKLSLAFLCRFLMHRRYVMFIVTSYSFSSLINDTSFYFIELSHDGQPLTITKQIVCQFQGYSKLIKFNQMRKVSTPRVKTSCWIVSIVHQLYLHHFIHHFYS